MKENLEVMIVGAGNRGMYTYGELSKRSDVGLKIVAVVEPDDEKREKMKIEHNIPKEKCFKTYNEAFSIPPFCDAVIISTPDRSHYPIATQALKKGYQYCWKNLCLLS